MKRVVLLLLLMGWIPCIGGAQIAKMPLGHSHNDYERRVPFYEAWVAGMASIEADIWLVDDELYVAHDREDIRPERTLRRMYLEPVAREMTLNGGRCEVNGAPLQLLIDLKTDYIQTLPALVKMLAEYPDCFDPRENPEAVRVVVSGSMPSPEHFADYPVSVSFDGRPGIVYDSVQLRRVALLSAPLVQYAAWNGQDELPEDQAERIAQFVQNGHDLGVKVRFWGCPDTERAWRTFINLGVDFINTDRPGVLGSFLEKEQKLSD